MDGPQEKYVCTTMIKTKKFHYEWIIENYSLNGMITGEYLTSTVFPDSIESNKFNLRLYPKGVTEKDQKFVSLFLHPDENIKHKVYVEYELSILNNRQEKRNVSKATRLFDTSAGYGPSSFIKTEELIDKEKGLLSNDTLIIMCELKVSDGVENSVKKIPIRKNTNKEKLEVEHIQTQSLICDKLGLFLRNEEVTDVIIVAKDKKIHAHKAILAAQSQVFLAMFKSDMIENLEGSIEISDFNSDVLNDMLLYVYTGKVKDFNSNTIDLLKVADKYAILELKAACENMLCDKINIDNAIDFLVLADFHCCDNLRKEVIMFTIAHKGTIMNSPAFESLKISHPLLVIDLLGKVVSQCAIEQ